MDSWLIIVITLVMSAFFSGIEIAFITANKLQIELLNKKGSWTAAILSNYIKQPSKFISTTLIGNNIALVIYGIYMGQVLQGYIIDLLPADFFSETVSLLLQTIISTLVVLLTAEFFPKVAFSKSPNLVLTTFIIPFQFFYILFWPIVQFVVWLSRTVLNAFMKEKITEDTPVFGKMDLDNYILESSNHDDEEGEVDTEMFRNALDFANIKLRECLVPRTEIVAVEINDDVTELYKIFTDKGLSKIIVYEENVDNIKGYVHQLDMFNKPQDIKSILIPIPIMSESMFAQDSLKEFTQQRKSIAWVVDEFGGTAGIVTIEDIMEEIFGEIEDEHDKDDLTEKKLADGSYLFSARVEVDHINETYELDIPTGDYETLGGFITSTYESIPEQGEIIQVEGFEFEILKAQETRIEEVKMRILPPHEDN